MTYFSAKKDEAESADGDDDEEINLDMVDYGSKNRKYFQRASTAFCMDCRPSEQRGNKNNSYLIMKNYVDNYTFNCDYFAKNLTEPSLMQQFANLWNHSSSLRLKYYIYLDYISFAWTQSVVFNNNLRFTYFLLNKFKLVKSF